jgi:hypothetical protein
MSPRSQYGHPHFAAHAVRAEQLAAAVLDLRMAGRRRTYRRIAATNRHIAQYRLLQSRISFVPLTSRR